jgi:hypothetical protein
MQGNVNCAYFGSKILKFYEILGGKRFYEICSNGWILPVFFGRWVWVNPYCHHWTHLVSISWLCHFFDIIVNIWLSKNWIVKKMAFMNAHPYDDILFKLSHGIMWNIKNFTLACCIFISSYTFKLLWFFSLFLYFVAWWETASSHCMNSCVCLLPHLLNLHEIYIHFNLKMCFFSLQFVRYTILMFNEKWRLTFSVP